MRVRSAAVEWWDSTACLPQKWRRKDLIKRIGVNCQWSVAKARNRDGFSQGVPFEMGGRLLALLGRAIPAL